jgi:hypothetical protein
LLAQNNAAENDKDGLPLHHLGTLMGPIGGSVKQPNLIDAALTAEFGRA